MLAFLLLSLAVSTLAAPVNQLKRRAPSYKNLVVFGTKDGQALLTLQATRSATTRARAVHTRSAIMCFSCVVWAL